MSRHPSFATAIAVLALASPLAAQATARDTSAVRVAPTTSTTSPAVTRSTPDPLALLLPTGAPAWTSADPVAAANKNAVTAPGLLDPQSSQSGAMMIVGGAALLVGAVVGGKSGTAIMVGGSVFGLIGLWRYLR